MKWKLLLSLVIVLVVMEGISWLVYRKSQEIKSSPSETTQSETPPSSSRVDMEPKKEGGENSAEEKTSEETLLAQGVSEEVTYPQITIEEKNGRVERTIHMGVRQYAWDPAELRVKEGDLVRLVIHNADVMHGIAIPELGVNADIPEEGAVVEFVATKRGTFEFSCVVYCGEGHREMRGRIVVE